jgi:hypothetical protein
MYNSLLLIRAKVRRFKKENNFLCYTTLMKSLLFVLLGVVLLGGLFFVIRPQQSSSPVIVNKQTEKSTSPTEKTHPQNSSFTLRVVNKKIIEGASTIRVKKGQMVIIHIISDEEDKLHVHGYDKSVALSKNELTTLAFRADIAGNFTFELEKAGVDLGTLEVQP